MNNIQITAAIKNVDSHACPPSIYTNSMRGGIGLEQLLRNL